MKVVFPTQTRDELIAHLRRGVAELAEYLPLRRATLFGSWAKGRATVASDVDVLIVYDGPVRDDAYLTVWRALNLRTLEPHIYTVEGAEAVGEVLGRMTESGVELLLQGA